MTIRLVVPILLVIGQGQGQQINSTTQDLPKPAPKPCFFATSENVTTEFALIIDKRCRTKHFLDKVEVDGKTHMAVDPKRCGVSSILDKTEVEQSDICYSPLGQGIAKNFIHTITVMNEQYETDLSDFRRRKFSTKKKQVEDLWNTMLRKSPDYSSWDFERAIVLKFEAPKLDSNSKVGLQIEAVLQFGPRASDGARDQLVSKWNNLLTNTTMGHFMLNDTGDNIKEVGSCPAIQTLADVVPETIWTASQSHLNMAQTPPVGGTVDLRCPDGKKFSFDNDTVGANDDRFSLICTAAEQFKIPIYWPNCGGSCWIRLPTPPLDTGLEPLVPTNTIPSGQVGTYRCKDLTFGLDKGPSPLFEVTCINGSDYDIPRDRWPVCKPKSTTVRPVIIAAVNEALREERMNIELRYQRIPQNQDFVNVKILDNEKNILHTTLPILAGLLILVLFICWMTHIHSPFYQLCSEKQKKKKIIKELKEEENKRSMDQDEVDEEEV